MSGSDGVTTTYGPSTSRLLAPGQPSALNPGYRNNNALGSGSDARVPGEGTNTEPGDTRPVDPNPPGGTVSAPNGTSTNSGNAFQTQASPASASNPQASPAAASNPQAGVNGVTTSPNTPPAPASTPLPPPADFRVRVSPLKAAEFFGSGGPDLMAPLRATNGVLFPYSPNVTVEQSVEYQPMSMIHTNNDYYGYQRTPSMKLTITGKFTCQNQTEGKYAMAAIHFFRTASKMWFGVKAGQKAGLPPPIMVLNGYGRYMFNNLNCILTQSSFAYADGVDTVPISVGTGVVRLPAMFDLTIGLTVQQTPQKMRDEFDLDAFRTGALMEKGGWI